MDSSCAVTIREIRAENCPELTRGASGFDPDSSKQVVCLRVNDCSKWAIFYWAKSNGLSIVNAMVRPLREWLEHCKIVSAIFVINQRRPGKYFEN